MSWVRDLEALQKDRKGSYYTEYEFASECRITGVLDYKKNSVMISPFTFEKDEDGLYHYLLRVRYPKSVLGYNDKADKRGYYFPDGAAGELISLCAVFFQCRFFLVASYRGESTVRSIKIKSMYPLVYRKTSPATHPKIFSEDNKNFATGLAIFLDSVRTLKSDIHQPFMMACFHYLRALKEVGADSEMVFIRLVSAIEVLSKKMNLKSQDDMFANVDLGCLVGLPQLSQAQKNEIQSIFDARKSKLRFIRFIESQSKGFFKGGNWKAKHVKITKKQLPKTLATIYNARSDYLHNGNPMYLSQFLRDAQKWDTDPSLGMIIDNRKFTAAQKLPYTYWFEDLVRHCLLNYLNAMKK